MQTDISFSIITDIFGFLILTTHFQSTSVFHRWRVQCGWSLRDTLVRVYDRLVFRMKRFQQWPNVILTIVEEYKIESLLNFQVENV